tara:strand:+ start:3814 stop:3984 length:171 start_codon:yes stop_codon:yes gene_type:complete
MIDWQEPQFPIPYPLKRSRGVYEELDMLWKEAQTGNPSAIERVKLIYKKLVAKSDQ